MTFTKRVENFVCERCGAQVAGNGYTNHCPHCLWSKHVDIEPGDRAHTCGGAMEPVALEGSSPQYRIIHRCQKCGFERAQDTQRDDDADALIALAARARS